MRARRRWTVLSALISALMVVVAITLAGVITNLATGSTIDNWDQAASFVSAITGSLAVLAATLTTFFLGRASNDLERAEDEKEQLAFLLIRTFAALEQETLELKKKENADWRRPLSLREVRAVLSAQGAWDNQDDIAFDLSTRARNSIVHGDLDSVDIIDLRYAYEKAQQALTKVRSVGHSSNLTTEAEQ